MNIEEVCTMFTLIFGVALYVVMGHGFHKTYLGYNKKSANWVLDYIFWPVGLFVIAIFD